MQSARTILRLSLPQQLQVLDVVLRQSVFLFVPAGTRIIATIRKPVGAPVGAVGDTAAEHCGDKKYLLLHGKSPGIV